MNTTTHINRIARRAKEEPSTCFTALAHLLTPEYLVETWGMLNRKGAAGVDKETMEDYAKNLDERVKELVEHLKRGSYQAPPVRRVSIPKPNGKVRKIGIPTVEDRLLQAAVARLLNALYEPLFLECSYGFRPKRSAHHALSKVRNIIMKFTSWVYEADIRSFFDRVNHQWLRRMLRLRIGDPLILRLIDKWLRAGVLDDGLFQLSEEGVPQGGPLSPILSNVYLHYALDLWYEKKFKSVCRGQTEIIRYADDWLVCFSSKSDLDEFSRRIENRLQKFNIELATEKTRILPFGRFTWTVVKNKKPEEFEFLGFRHIIGKDRKGRFAVIRLPATKKIRCFRKKVKEWMRRGRMLPVAAQQKHLSSMLRGFFQYFALPHCLSKLYKLHKEVLRLWKTSLERRGNRAGMSWQSLGRKPWFRLPAPKPAHTDS